MGFVSQKREDSVPGWHRPDEHLLLRHVEQGGPAKTAADVREIFRMITAATTTKQSKA